MKKVLIIEAQMKQYRAPFYALLNQALRKDGVQLTVAYSDPPPSDEQKKDTCELPLDYSRKIRGYWIWPNRLLFQPLIGEALRSDLVILDQGNRFLLNHLLLPLSRVGLLRVAFWGLGENLQAGQIGFSEWYRRKTLNWVSWWFAYTKDTAQYLESRGVPASIITAVQNSLDTHEISDKVGSLTPGDRHALRARMGIGPCDRVGIFCGILDESKKVRLLLESSRTIRAQIPGFHLIIAGGGPQADLLLRLAEELPWVRLTGPRFGTEKAELLAISDVFLLPGRVGLAVLDAFAAGLPMLTTRIPIHGPEIEYLEEGVNGLMTASEPEAYAEAVSSVLRMDERLSRLRAGAKVSAEKYSIQNMVANFRTGIRLALSNQPWARKRREELLVRSE
jgi:L-malate glycosyltransferase